MSETISAQPDALREIHARLARPCPFWSGAVEDVDAWGLWSWLAARLLELATRIAIERLRKQRLGAEIRADALARKAYDLARELATANNLNPRVLDCLDAAQMEFRTRAATAFIECARRST